MTKPQRFSHLSNQKPQTHEKQHFTNFKERRRYDCKPFLVNSTMEIVSKPFCCSAVSGSLNLELELSSAIYSVCVGVTEHSFGVESICLTKLDFGRRPADPAPFFFRFKDLSRLRQDLRGVSKMQHLSVTQLNIISPLFHISIIFPLFCVVL